LNQPITITVDTQDEAEKLIKRLRDNHRRNAPSRGDSESDGDSEGN
jgi:hypothetical protein